MQDDEKQLEIEGVVQPVLRDHGLMLVDLEWRPRRPRGVLRLFVDKPGGVGIDDCQRVSREVGDVLDASALIEEAYDLEVSSPGLDRQLRKEREFRWAVGKRVPCWRRPARAWDRPTTSASTSTARRATSGSTSASKWSTRSPTRRRRSRWLR